MAFGVFITMILKGYLSLMVKTLESMESIDTTARGSSKITVDTNGFNRMLQEASEEDEHTYDFVPLSIFLILCCIPLLVFTFLTSYSHHLTQPLFRKRFGTLYSSLYL